MVIRKKGSMLVEVMVFTVACGVVLSVSILIIHRTMALADRIDQSAQLHRETDRLSEMLAVDVAASRKVVVIHEQDATRLQLWLEGKVVNYMFRDSSVVRIQTSASNDSMVNREAFQFDEDVMFEVEQTINPCCRIAVELRRQRIERVNKPGSLTFAHDAAHEGVALVSSCTAESIPLLRMQGILGFDLRFAGMLEGEGTE